MAEIVTPPNNLQALAFDIDRTLSNRQKQVSTRTRQVIAHMTQQNKYQLFLCTGRSWRQAKGIVDLFSESSIHVFDGGGTVATTSGKILHEELLPSEIVQEIARRADELGAEIEIDHQGKLYSNARKQKKYPHFLSLDDLTDWSTALLCLQWINDDVRQMVQEYRDIEAKEMLSEVNGPYFDITCPGVTKAKGLQKWSQLTGIALNNIAGFGDSQNDLEFLSVVGWKVAMGNSILELKNIVDQVIGDCDDDGLAEYLEQVFV